MTSACDAASPDAAGRVARAHQLGFPQPGLPILPAAALTGPHGPRAAQTFSAAVQSVVTGAPDQPGSGDHPTPRELEVAFMRTLAGMKRQEVADALRISVKTVEAHWRNLAAKADCHERELRDRLLGAFWWHCGWEARAATSEGHQRPREAAGAAS